MNRQPGCPLAQPTRKARVLRCVVLSVMLSVMLSVWVSVSEATRVPTKEADRSAAAFTLLAHAGAIPADRHMSHTCFTSSLSDAPCCLLQYSCPRTPSTGKHQQAASTCMHRHTDQGAAKTCACQAHMAGEGQQYRRSKVGKQPCRSLWQCC